MIDEKDSFLKDAIDEEVRRELDPRTDVIDYDEIAEFGQYIGVDYGSAVDILLGTDLDEAIGNYYRAREEELENFPEEPSWYSKKGSRGQRWYPVPSSKSVQVTPSSPNRGSEGRQPTRKTNVGQNDETVQESDAELVTRNARRIDEDQYEDIMEKMGREVVTGKWGSLGISEYTGRDDKRTVIEEEMPTMMERESFPDKKYVLYKDPETRIIAGVRKAEPLIFFDSPEELETNLESLLEQ